MKTKMVSWQQPVAVILVASLVLAGLLPQVSFAQSPGKTSPAGTQRTSSAQALEAANAQTQAMYAELEQQWRNIFRECRSRKKLTRFVGDTLDIVEKLRQVHDFVVDPKATEKRVGTLFRQQILDEATVCRLLEESLKGYVRHLDEQDQALLIRLKVDRSAPRTRVSQSTLDIHAFKQPVAKATAETVTAVQNDMARTIAAFVASEAIGAATKNAARQAGVMPGEQGSAADLITGLLIDIGIGMAVDAATDPTPKMVADLESRLGVCERAILDGAGNKPGFLTVVKQLTQERIAARHKLLAP